MQDIVERTGLPRDVVDAAVGHLVRIGRVVAEELTTGCPGGGCGSCVFGVDGRPGWGGGSRSAGRFGPSAGDTRRGLVALVVGPGSQKLGGALIERSARMAPIDISDEGWVDAVTEQFLQPRLERSHDVRWNRDDVVLLRA